MLYCLVYKKFQKVYNIFVVSKKLFDPFFWRQLNVLIMQAQNNLCVTCL